MDLRRVFVTMDCGGASIFRLKFFMKNRIVVSLLAMGLSAMGLLADQIVMKNGDRVTGSIIK